MHVLAVTVLPYCIDLYLMQDCIGAQELAKNPAYGRAESSTDGISKVNANPAYGASRKSMCLGTKPSMHNTTVAMSCLHDK